MTKVDVLPAADPPASLSMFSPINRVTQLSDGTVVLHDITVTSEAPDSQGESVDYDSFKAVAPAFMKWATVGEMHDPDRWDAGTVLKLYLDDEARRASADIHVVDPIAVRKVLAKVYKAVSLHGEWAKRTLVKMGGKDIWRVVLKFIDEISLVPRGANPDATLAKRFVLAKMGPPEGGVDREDIPAEDFAGPDKTFPIVTPSSVEDAGSLIGHAADPAAVKRKIIAIAHRKGPAFVAAIPEAWKEEDMTTAKAAAEAVPVPEPTKPAPQVVPIDDISLVPPKVAKADAPDDGKPFPGAKPPFGKAPKCADGKCGKCSKCAKIAKKLAKANDPVQVAKTKLASERAIAKAQKIVTKAKAPKVAKGKGLKAGLKAQAAVSDAMQAKHKDQADGEDAGDKLDALQNADDALHDFNGAESSDEGDDVSKSLARRIVKERRVAKAKLAKSRKVAKSAKRRLAKMRKGSGIGRLTKTLAKAGARNSATDQAKIEGIHDLTVGLGYAKCVSKAEVGAVHDVAPPPDAVLTPLDAAISKAQTTPIDFEAILREAIPQIGRAAVAQIEASLGQQVKDLTTEVAKIGSAPAGGGPSRFGVFDPTTRTWLPAEGQSAEVAKSDALRAAADVTADPLVKQQLRQEAGLDMLKRETPWRR